MNLLHKLLKKPRAEGISESPNGRPAPHDSAQNRPAACPYCGVILDPPPGRSRKCPACKEAIVRRKDWRGAGTILYLSQDEARAFDQKYEVAAERAESVRRSLNIGATESDFVETERKLAAKWGVAQPGDVFWDIAVSKLQTAMRLADWQRMGFIYFSQALFLYDSGKPHMRLLQEAAKCELRSLEESGLSQASILAIEPPGGCAICWAAHDRRFTISDALTKMPVPNPRCTNGWCRCTWLAVLD